MILQKNELYQEIELFDGDKKIGEAEIEINGKMLSRLSIFEPYQNMGYGTKIVKQLIDEYGIDCLWVNADNERAIHVYEKCGFKKKLPTMFLMEIENKRQTTKTSGLINNEMNNLIKRQDAIDAIIERDASCGIDSAEVIKRLPSAEPKIIRCKDCKYYYNTNPENIPTANIICFQMHEDDYCSYAERRAE